MAKPTRELKAMLQAKCDAACQAREREARRNEAERLLEGVDAPRDWTGGDRTPPKRPPWEGN